VGEPSAVPPEIPYGLGRTETVEIDVAALRKANHALWLIGEREQLLAEPYRHDAVLFAMQDQKRRPHTADRSSKCHWSFASQLTGTKG